MVKIIDTDALPHIDTLRSFIHAVKPEKLIVNSIVKHVQAEEQHCTFQVEEDEVRVGPYY